MDVVVSHQIEKTEIKGLHTPPTFDVSNGINVWDQTSCQLSARKRTDLSQPSVSDNDRLLKIQILIKKLLLQPHYELDFVSLQLLKVYKQ